MSINRPSATKAGKFTKEFLTSMGISKNALLDFFSNPIKEAILISYMLSGLSPKKETQPQETTTPEL